MILPKYRFYIGKAINFSMIDNTYIDPTTGEQDTAINAVSSYSVNVSTNLIYVNYNPSRDIFDNINNITAEGLSICMYGIANTYLGKIGIDKAKVCTLKEGTKSIVIEFRGMTSDIMKIHKDFVKTGFSEVYSIQSINPHYKKLSKKYARESNQKFFRISLEGKIGLFNKDYEFVKNSSINDTLGFFIEKLNTIKNEWYEYYKGQFNKTDCKLDYERKKCELKLTALDMYSKVMSNYESVYDLVKLKPEITKIDIHKRPLTQVYIRGANSISNFFGGTYWEDDVNDVIDSHEDLINKYYFSYIKAGNEFYISDAGILEVNGVYAGINGNWTQQKGYTCYLNVAPGESDYIRIKRNSDNTILYQSSEKYWSLYEDNCYLNREDIEMVNVNNQNDKFIIKSPFVYHIYQRLLCDVDTIQDSEGVKNTYDLPLDDFVTDNRNYKKCIGLKNGLFFCTSRTANNPTRYGVNDYNEYFTNKFIPATVGYGRPLPICRNTWTNASLWYVYDNITYPILEEKLKKKYTLKDTYSIAAVIKALLNKVDPTLRHEATAEYSRFLYDSDMPISNNRFYVFITQKTNILKGQYDQAAQKAEISLKDVMDMLRDCFRCYWYIDNNKFKIEHISFFMNGGSYSNDNIAQLDFTKLADQFNKKLTSYFQSELEYEKSELNQRYEFSWMDDATELFGGVTIDVNAKYIQPGKKEDVSIKLFSSDIDFMLFSPSNFSNDGFALLCPIKDGTTYEIPIVKSRLLDEDGIEYDFTAQNWYASWPYLVRQFYMNDMPAQSVNINTFGNVQANDIKRSMEHSLEFITAKDPDELELITTSIGDGVIDEISIDIDTRLTTVKLLYQPE